jgi:AraC family transcriptional regulator
MEHQPRALNAGRAEYERRMHRVLEYVDRHLDRPLDLAELAAVAHFSAFHFHRLFAAWMGETLGEYLRRRRLEVAAQRLLAQPKVPVLDIALAVGFGSGEAFARAFRSRFGCTASEWRRQRRRREERKHDQAQGKHDQAPGRASGDDGTSQPPEEVSMHPIDVKVIERAPVKVAYLRHVGPYGEAIGAFWRERVGPWMAANDLLGRPRYGFGHDDPDITAPEQCRYDACVEAPDGFVATGPALTTTIPGGRYATARFFGTSAQIKAAWTALLRDWLPASNLQLDARPCFEHYPSDARYDEKSGAFECELVIPVAPL